MAWTGGTSRGFPTKTRRIILDRDPVCRCQGCRDHEGQCGQLSTEADHIVNVARGGTNDETNGQGLCESCHRAKTQHEAHANRPRRQRPAESHPGATRVGYTPRPPRPQGVGSPGTELEFAL